MDGFLGKARAYVRETLPTVPRHGAAEMFLHLLERGADAQEAGNYGIAAAYVVRSGGSELVVFGENTLFTGADPAGHAEMNALRHARKIASAGAAELDELLADPRRALLRPAPHGRDETLLYSTLEPCPMCSVALLNAAVAEVVIGIPDPHAGAMLRLESLAPLWAEFARDREMAVRLVTESAGEPDAIRPELLRLLEALFLEGKRRLDDRLLHHGSMPVGALGAIARGETVS
jgi:tRNA(adenine34) deaminase